MSATYSLICSPFISWATISFEVLAAVNFFSSISEVRSAHVSSSRLHTSIQVVSSLPLQVWPTPIMSGTVIGLHMVLAVNLPQTSRRRVFLLTNSFPGAVYSVIAAIACFAPRLTFQLYGIVPVPAWLVVSGIFTWDAYNSLKDSVSASLGASSTAVPHHHSFCRVAQPILLVTSAAYWQASGISCLVATVFSDPHVHTKHFKVNPFR